MAAHLDTFCWAITTISALSFLPFPHCFWRTVLGCVVYANTPSGGQDVEVDLSTEIIKQHFQVSQNE